jgi:hypothetical protein
MELLVEEFRRNLRLSVHVTAYPHVAVAIIQTSGIITRLGHLVGAKLQRLVSSSLQKRAGIEPPARLFFALSDPSGHTLEKHEYERVQAHLDRRQ